MEGYTVNATWDADARVWVATSDDVPGLVVEGKTLEIVGRKCDLAIPALSGDPR